MKKIISYSLWGGDPIYVEGLFKNYELKQKIFIDWKIRVYHNYNSNSNILERLKTIDIELVHINNDLIPWSMWRFLPSLEDDVIFISRDLDSRLSIRDEVAVNEFLESEKKIHIIREHPLGHAWFMNAGMWGAKPNAISNIFDLIINYKKEVTEDKLGSRFLDQYFLANVIYDRYKDICFIHDEYTNINDGSVKIKRDRELDDFAFIGESLDENDNPRGDQRLPIKQLYYQSRNNV